jgi:hypothetical protein
MARSAGGRTVVAGGLVPGALASVAVDGGPGAASSAWTAIPIATIPQATATTASATAKRRLTVSD